MSNPRHRPKKGGFTLIELIVVTAIIIILVGIAVPSMSQFFKGQALETSKRLIQSLCNTARRQAVTKRKEHRVVFYRVQDGTNIKYAARVYNVPDEEWVGETFLFPSNVEFAGSDSTLEGSGITVYGVYSDIDLEATMRSPGGGDRFIEFDSQGTPDLERVTLSEVEVGEDGLEITDPASNVRELPANTTADIKLLHTGSRTMALIYISASNGKVRGAVVRMGAGDKPDTLD